MSESHKIDDPYSLVRFVEAQEGSYALALSELKRGKKLSHWMWYVFPQFDGLGSSSMSKKYAIKSRREASAYLDHPILGGRLLECIEVLLQLQGISAYEIFGEPDVFKLCSCATLFASVSAEGSPFEQLLEKYYSGEGDRETLRRLGATSGDSD